MRAWLSRQLKALRNWHLAPLVQQLHLMQEQSVHQLQVRTLSSLAKLSGDQIISLKQALTAASLAQERTLGLRFEAPRTTDQGIALLSALSPILDIYLQREAAYPLVASLMRHYQQLWPYVARHVVTPSGVSLEQVAWQSLGVQGLLEAIGVFSEGIAQLEIADHYLSYRGGLSSQALLSLFHDLHYDQVRNNANSSISWQDLVGLSLEYSALVSLKQSSDHAEARALQQQLLEGLSTLMEVTHGNT